MSDLIDRQAAIDAADAADYTGLSVEDVKKVTDEVVKALKNLPSAQPTLYGYKIEHLALIARVMEKEGITPEKAVETFGDIVRIANMLIEEIQNKVNKEIESWAT